MCRDYRCRTSFYSKTAVKQKLSLLFSEIGRNSLGDDTDAFLDIITSKLVLQLEGITVVYRLVLNISTRRAIESDSKYLNTLPLN